MIPIIVACYNNYKYVDNTINQIKKINPEYEKYITIMDNNSDCEFTINYLQNSNIPIIWNKYNNGPWINEGTNECTNECTNKGTNKGIYNLLPDKFILTDPDLEFNKNIPTNFLEILSTLSDKYKCCKIGFALDISDYDKMFNGTYFYNLTIKDWELRHWNEKIVDDIYELYNADIDTTFCLINKLHKKSDIKIRVAGNFTAKHIPWYIKNNIYNEYENYILNKNATGISTISKLINSYYEDNYIKIYKNDELFLVDKNSCNKTNFIKNEYANFQPDIFNLFDSFTKKDKIVIDIGSGIGKTTMYLSRKSKHVYSIESNKQKFEKLNNNCNKNCLYNFTLINKFLYNEDNIEIDIDDDLNIIKTITLKNIIQTYTIKVFELSLINVNINGNEENILNDLYDIQMNLQVPIIITFNFNLWKNKNLDRFSFLTNTQKEKIVSDPLCYILFN